MSKKSLVAGMGILTLAFLPLVSQAQTAGSNAPLGSKQNPIKPSSVSNAPPNGSSSSKGKRGSKANPIAGSVHPRNSN